MGIRLTTTYPEGVDISHWEGTIDYPTLKTTPVSFVIPKATEDVDFTDPKWIENKAGCQSINTSLGAFHFFHPLQHPIEQADYFVDVVGDNCYRYTCDLETVTLSLIYGSKAKAKRGMAKLRKPLYANKIARASISGIVDNTKAFLDRLLYKTGNYPNIYTSPGFWNTYMRPTPSWTSMYDLWVAHWTTAIKPTLPLGWTDWVMWQYTDRGVVPGIPSSVDLNRFNGTHEDVIRYFGTATEPPTVPLYVWASEVDTFIRTLGYSGSKPEIPSMV